MSSSIDTLTPQMRDYQAHFSDSGSINWQPYLMYFHPFGHCSETVNTDSSGFRYTSAKGLQYSVADHGGVEKARLIVGSSTVFGIGASSDGHTLAARLSIHDRRAEPWINFGGRSFNSTQELLLFVLSRELLPEIADIVIFSGFNNLGLARLPDDYRRQHGAFFLCDAFRDMVAPKKASWIERAGWTSSSRQQEINIENQIAYAVNQTAQHLSVWKALADQMGAKLYFVLQPLANWVRDKGSFEEEAIFAELELKGRFAETYGAILTSDCQSNYAAQLNARCVAMDIRFINFAPILRESTSMADWLFVDRIHFTDHGHDLTARLLLELL